ncbi:hypothetical protein SLS60_000100 [Paraconiothyrium brasiliense]|uniref:Uncharacterized protein n=1 Tax=Paraconiothyrium brasiliense TaxID=300254 RepID=A0ABR3S631_9PLEO
MAFIPPIGSYLDQAVLPDGLGDRYLSWEYYNSRLGRHPYEDEKVKIRPTVKNVDTLVNNGHTEFADLSSVIESKKRKREADDERELIDDEIRAKKLNASANSIEGYKYLVSVWRKKVKAVQAELRKAPKQPRTGSYAGRRYKEVTQDGVQEARDARLTKKAIQEVKDAKITKDSTAEPRKARPCLLQQDDEVEDAGKAGQEQHMGDDSGLQETLDAAARMRTFRGEGLWAEEVEREGAEREEERRKREDKSD